MDDSSDWFIGWDALGDVLISALLFYLLIVILVRVMGKRTTAQLNNFDWIINITVGSLAASGILLDSVPATHAADAIIVIALLQFALTWLAVRSDFVTKLIKASPTLLTHKGNVLESAMLGARISQAELYSVLRAHGITDVKDANWVILESDGSMTVLPRNETDLHDAGSMDNVDTPENLPEPAERSQS